jgi:hypothetical protein
MKRRVFGVLVAITTLIGFVESAYGSPAVTKITVTAEAHYNGDGTDSTPFVGACPVRVTFKAAVVARETSFFTYRWERSDAANDTASKRADITATLIPPSATHTPIEDIRVFKSDYTGVQRLVVLGLTGGLPRTTVAANVKREVHYTITCWSWDLAIVSITSVPVDSPKPCDNVIYKFQVTVKSQGSAPYSPEMDLWVVSQDHRNPNRLTSAGGWGTAARIPELITGQSTTVLVPILHPAGDPTFMASQRHTFSVVIDPLGRVTESKRANNTSTITVDPPVGCPMARSDVPLQKGAPAAQQQQRQFGAPAERAEPPLPAMALNRAPGVEAKKDAANCNDHPLFARLQDYWIESCKEKPRDSYNFDLGKGRSVVEGRYWYIRYQPPAGLITKPSTLELLRNAEATVRKAGGEVVASDSGKATLKLTNDGKELWVEVWADHLGKYILTIVEKAAN